MGNSRYPDRAGKLLGEWWKNHIPPPWDKQNTNIAIVGEPRSLIEAIELSDASEWELAIQEEYESLIANDTWELTPLLKGHEVQVDLSNKKWCQKHIKKVLWTLKLCLGGKDIVLRGFCDGN